MSLLFSDRHVHAKLLRVTFTYLPELISRQHAIEIKSPDEDCKNSGFHSVIPECACAQSRPFAFHRLRTACYLIPERLTMLTTNTACWVGLYSHATVAGERAERSGRR